MAGSFSDTFGPMEAVAVTPSDAADVFTDGPECRFLYVGTAGNVAVQMAEGASVIYRNLAVGFLHNLVFSRVLATGTTASNIVAGR